MPCRGGCGQYHLKNQDGCLECKAKVEADERRYRAEQLKVKENQAKKHDDAFRNPGKDRKKPRKKP